MKRVLIIQGQMKQYRVPLFDKLRAVLKEDGIALRVAYSAPPPWELAKNDNPSKEELVEHMDGNLCRCMTYGRIQRAVLRAAAEMRSSKGA